MPHAWAVGTVRAMAATIEDRTAEARALMEEWDAAWARRDAKGLAACFTEDGTYEDPNLAHVLRGRAELEAYFASMITAIPDIEVHQRELLVSPDGATTATQWAITGTFRHDYDSGGHSSFPLAATGDRVDFTGMALLTSRGGRVASLRQYADYTTFQRQLGLIPPQRSMGERVLVALQKAGAKRRRKRNGL